MKKILPYALALFIFSGCVNNTQNIKPLSSKSIDLLDKYGISENALMKIKGGYVFVIPDPNGSAVYKLDQNYRYVWKKVTPVLLDPVKSEVKNDKLYILGYDQKKNKVALLKYDSDGKLLGIKYYGKQYDLAKDFQIINGKTYIAVTQYTKNNNSDIVIYSDNKTLNVSTPNMDEVNFILPYQKGLLIIGTTQTPSEDILIVYKTFDNKTVWAKTIDMGMDERPLEAKTEKGVLVLKVLSTDHMGAETEATFKIDTKGNVIGVEKGIEFKPLPIKLRT